MLIDFCQSFMKSKIKSDKVSFDGYEPTNLVAEDVTLKRKGFMSDHFVKPPVSVTVKFPCNVAIYRIVIDPVIGHQQSCDIRIFSAAERVTDSWLYMNGNSDAEAVETDGTLFNVIGNVTNKTDVTGIICFQNNYFKECRMWQIDDFPELSEYSITSELRSRKPGCLCSVSHVTVSVMRTKHSGPAAIKRLEIWGKPSASVHTRQQGLLLKTYEEHTRPAPVDIHTVIGDESTSTKPDSVHADKNTELTVNGIEIPEDFVDIITCNIMAVPMLLPCGKAIDQSTLERYIDTEASWGRAPNDPFTGIVFRPGTQPVINASLKSRLDQFLLLNSDKLENVPRTLGRADKVGTSSTMKTSRLVQDGASQSKHGTDSYSPLCKRTSPSHTSNRSSTDSTNHAHSSSLTQTIHSSAMQPNQAIVKHSSGNKRKHCDIEVSNHSVSGNIKRLREPFDVSTRRMGERTSTVAVSCDATNLPVIPDFRGEETIDLTGSEDLYTNSTVSRVASKICAHSDNLTSSLDAALCETLGGLPSFTSFTKHTSSSSKYTNSASNYNNENSSASKQNNSGSIVHAVNHTSAGTTSLTKSHSCCFCMCDLGQGDDSKYLLPCKHIACRKCLGFGTQPILKKCGQCNLEFTSNMLVRVFNP